MERNTTRTFHRDQSPSTENSIITTPIINSIDILTLQGYEIQMLEEQIFAEEVEDDIISNFSLRIREREKRKHTRSESNIQRNESLTKYLLSLRTQIH